MPIWPDQSAGFDGPRLAFALGANDQLVDAAAYRDLVIAWRNRFACTIRPGQQKAADD